MHIWTLEAMQLASQPRLLTGLQRFRSSMDCWICFLGSPPRNVANLEWSNIWPVFLPPKHSQNPAWVFSWYGSCFPEKRMDPENLGQKSQNLKSGPASGVRHHHFHHIPFPRSHELCSSSSVKLHLQRKKVFRICGLWKLPTSLPLTF